ncbi:MAG: sugar phosphorylase [Natronospirillum sp.]|uniref:sugar phosphorylase n=1 Tax=Natronospirillum sp. TaxID=2812955 RepID=UPI0025CEA6C1|nr:sugar phosphorylase [Natronospirillum sp.]MCH8552316.1 sugar phosphorylase [Natronospirillum sp.]
MTEIDANTAARVRAHCAALYQDAVADQCTHRILTMIQNSALHQSGATLPALSEQDVLLITYGNSIEEPGTAPLQTLDRFLTEWLPELSHVHILPFFPYSSDDGFSVIDYLMLDPALGSWADIRRLGESRALMFDFVLNHISRESVWFADFVANHPPGKDYFIEMPEDTDVSQVVRPRSQALLAPIYTRRGVRHVWATFSPDQIDLNYENPEVLLEMVRIFIIYLEQEASLIRLDAVAFLWKELGTRCIHLPQTHEVVKLLRVIAEQLRPGSLIITETNVPHAENLSYFGDGDEAHLVYQFALPPLVLYTMNRGNADLLTNWAQSLAPPPPGCTFLNFTASHDGIGLRALEGILPTHEISSIIESMQQFGGYVSMRANPDGTDSPYEINITYFDAMMGTRRGPDQWQVDRFICAQSIMLVLQGLPAFYIHSLLGTPNDQRGVEVTGRLRSINRKRWALPELTALLEKTGTPQSQVYFEMRRRIALRQSLPALSPDAAQKIYDLDSHLFIVQRGEGEGMVVCVFNVAPQDVSLSLVKLFHSETLGALDLLSRQQHGPGKTIDLMPYQCLWLVPVEDEGTYL